MSSWLSSTFSKMLLLAICYHLLIHLGPFSKAVARPNLWPAGETLPSSLRVSSQAVEPENISGFGNAALERGDHIPRYLPGNEPMPQQPNSITMGIDKHNQVMPEGSSSYRPEKRLKMDPEHDLERWVLSNWAPGNMVRPSKNYMELPQEVPGFQGPPDQQAQLYQEGHHAQSELSSKNSLLHLLSSNLKYPANISHLDQLTSNLDFSPNMSFLPLPFSDSVSAENEKFSFPSPNLPFFDSTENFLEGIQAFPEESIVHPKTSYGLGKSSSNSHPGLLEPQLSVPGYFQTDWGGTESSINDDKLLEYIQELNALIGHQDLPGFNVPFESPEGSQNHQISSEDQDLNSNYQAPEENRNFELLSSDKASTSNYEVRDSNMNGGIGPEDWEIIQNSQMESTIKYSAPTEINQSKYSIPLNGSKYNERISDLIDTTGGSDERLTSAIKRVSNWFNIGDIEKKISRQASLRGFGRKSAFKCLARLHNMESFAEVEDNIPVKRKDVSTGILDKKDQIITQKFKTLFKWLIIINTAVAEGIKLDGNNTNKELINWFFKKLFQPEDIQSVKFQAKLLQKMTLKKTNSAHESLYLSLFVLKFWYMYFKPHIWVKIQNLDQDKTPEMNMIFTAVSRAISERIMANPNSDDFYQSVQLEDLKIPKIDIFPETMKPKRSLSKSNKELSPPEEAIVDKTCKIASFPHGYEIKKTPEFIQGLSMDLFLYGKVPKNQEFLNKYRTKIRISKNKEHYIQNIRLNLRFLLCHLKIFHRQLILFMDSKRMNMVSNAENQFIQWFNDILFKAERNFIPVFGDVIVEKVGVEHIRIEPVQKYLINEYFSSENSQSKVSQVSLAIIFYWYKKLHSDCFFEKEEDYWKLMIENLGSMMSKGGKYTLIKFDNKGNYHKI